MTLEGYFLGPGDPITRISRNDLRDLFSMFLRHRRLNPQNLRKNHPKGPTGAPGNPECPPNPPPRHPKSNFLRKMRTLENISFYCGFGTLGRPGVDFRAVKTAIVAPTTHPTPKNGENCGPMAPEVAQVAPNGVPEGRHTNALFRPIFGKFPQSGQSGPQGGPRPPKRHQNGARGYQNGAPRPPKFRFWASKLW